MVYKRIQVLFCFLLSVLVFSSCRGEQTGLSNIEEAKTSCVKESSPLSAVEESSVPESSEFTEYKGDVSKFIAQYVRYDSATNEIFSYRNTYETFDVYLLIEENHNVTLFRNGMGEPLKYTWKAVSKTELALFQNGDDSGIRLFGIQGSNQRGFGILRKTDPDGSEPQDYIRTILNPDLHGAYLPVDDLAVTNKAPYHIYIEDGGGSVRNDNQYLFRSQVEPSPFQMELDDTSLGCSRKFDDDENHYEIRNEYGHLIYTFVREGEVFILQKETEEIGKYTHFSNLFPEAGCAGSFEPLEEKCALPAFELTGEEYLVFYDFCFTTHYAQFSVNQASLGDQANKYDEFQFRVMGSKQNDWIVLHPEYELYRYNMVFYTLRPENENLWSLHAHHQDGSITVEGRYLFTAAGN